jgi:hypothetical protein
MKNPLRKRLPRELKGELGKYLVVFILMVLTIGMVSGFLVADGSMIVASLIVSFALEVVLFLIIISYSN